MPAIGHVPEYAPPVLRAPSPASSVGTVYGEDQTSLSDLELDDAAFARKYEDLLELHKPRKEEEEANQSPLIERPEKGSQVERELFEKTILSLRRRVREIEENDLFERMLLRGSQAGLVQPPSTADIDKLMRNMMGANTQTRKPRGVEEPAQIAPGPWLKKDTPLIPPPDLDEDSEAEAESVFTSLGTAGAPQGTGP